MNFKRNEGALCSKNKDELQVYSAADVCIYFHIWQNVSYLPCHSSQAVYKSSRY